MRNKKKAILFTAQSSKIGFLIYNHGNTREEEAHSKKRTDCYRKCVFTWWASMAIAMVGVWLPSYAQRAFKSFNL